MFVRIRWFLIGVASTLGVGMWLVTVVKRARERLTPAAMGRAAAVTGAGLLEATGRRLVRSGGEAEPAAGSHPGRG